MGLIGIEVQDLTPSKLHADIAQMYANIEDTDTTPGLGRIHKPFGVIQPPVVGEKSQGASTTCWASGYLHPVDWDFRRLLTSIVPGEWITRSAAVDTNDEELIEQYATVAGAMDDVQVYGWTCDLNIWGRRTDESQEVAKLRMEYWHRAGAVNTLLDSYTTPGDLTTDFANYPGTVTFTHTWGVDDLFIMKLIGVNDGMEM